MAKLTNTTIYGAANITGNLTATGSTFDISANAGISLSNANTISSIQIVTAGTNYQNVPAVIIANTTTGGVTANANAVMRISSTFTVGNVGAGYANGDFLYANVTNSLANAVFVVTSNTLTTFGTGGINGLTMANSGLFFTMPAYFNSAGVLNTGNPNWIQITGTSGAGAGANVNVAIGGIQVNNVFFQTTGSGYVEQPTVTFSGGSPVVAANGYVITGGATKIVGIGSSSINGRSGTSLAFYTPSGIMRNVPSLTLQESLADQDSFINIFSSASYCYLYSLGNTNAGLSLGSNGSGAVGFNTSGGNQTRQMTVTHTASAVNYVQVTGAATGGRPVVSAQGSDANVNLTMQSKGTFGFTFQNSLGATIFNGTHGNSSTSNFFTFNATIPGSQPTISVLNSVDTDVDITLTPKGAGLVRFGTYTAGAPAATGYITMKAADGTTYKILVST
jgi:hypothetical protein